MHGEGENTLDMLEILLAVVSLLLILFLFRHRLRPGKRRLAKPVTPQEKQYHCVSIVLTPTACQAIRALEGKRFLSKEAPRLPLAECDCSQCDCKYQHHEDRRVPFSDRRLDYGMSHDLYGAFGETNRRDNPKGRRYSDLAKPRIKEKSSRTSISETLPE